MNRRQGIAGTALVAFALLGCGEETQLPHGDVKDAGPIDSQLAVSYADTEGPQQVVVLGDSIAAGYGVPYRLAFGALLMDNDDTAYPDFEGRDLDTLRPGSERTGLGVNGATSADVLRDQIPNVPANATLVLISVGGNDFIETALQTPALEAGVADAEAMGARLDEILLALSDVDRFGALPHVYLLNIYDATDGVGDVENVFAMAGVRSWPAAKEVHAAFNAEIARVAQAHGAQLVDMYHHFLGHGYHHADALNPYHDRSDPSGWFQSDYIHPNQRGHSEIRALFLDAIFGD